MSENGDSGNPVLRFVELTRRKRALEAELEGVKSSLTTAVAHVLAKFEVESCRAMECLGMSVFTRVESHARIPAASNNPAGHDAAVAALQSNPDTAFLVRPDVNWKQLESWVRERPLTADTLERDIPPDLRPHIKVYEEIKVIGNEKGE